jgi:hypothetical protein
MPRPCQDYRCDDRLAIPIDGKALTVKIVVAAAIVAVLASAVLAVAAAHRSSIFY